MESQESYLTAPDRFAEDILHVHLHDGQGAWLRCTAKTKVACCGRRWGKSFSTAADLIWFAVTRNRTQQFLIAPTHDQSTIIFRYVVQMVRDSEISGLATKIVYSPFPEIHFLNGSVIRARSAGNDASNIRGHGADRIVLDEAAFIPEVVYATIAPLLANSEYGQLTLISTPFGKNTFYEYWQRGQYPDTDTVSFQFPSSSSPHVSQGYLAQQRAELTEMQYAQEYGAEFHDDQNAVFKYSHIQAAIDDTIDAEPVHGHHYVAGFDPAKWSDRSAVVVLDITEEPWRVVRAMDIGGKDYLDQAAHVKLICREYGDCKILLDATSHDQMLEQLKKDGVRVAGLKWTNEVKQELMNGLAIALERGQLKIPRNPTLIKELTYYRAEITAAGNVKLGAPQGAGHYDDLVSALAMALHAQLTHRGGGVLFANTEKPRVVAAAPGEIANRFAL